MPNELAMVPLADLVNHDGEQLDLTMYVTPDSLFKEMMTVNYDMSNEKSEQFQSYEQARGFKDSDPQEMEEYLCPDFNQHEDEYPSKYQNYKPEEISPSDGQPFGPEAVEALFVRENSRRTIDELPKMNWVFEQIWDLNDAEIGFGLKVGKRCQIKKHEQMFITYGDRANSFLLVEYGFTVPDNPLDFVRRSDVTLNTFYS